MYRRVEIKIGYKWVIDPDWQPKTIYSTHAQAVDGGREKAREYEKRGHGKRLRKYNNGKDFFAWSIYKDEREDKEIKRFVVVKTSEKDAWSSDYWNES